MLDSCEAPRPKEDGEKTGPKAFFRLCGRKLPQLVRLNLCFFLPALAAFICMLALFLYDSHIILRLPDDTGTVQFATWPPFAPYPPGGGSGEIDGVWLDIWSGVVMFLPLIALSPFTAGLTLVTRLFIQGEHAFVWSDFWRGVKENWKYFLLNGLVCYLVYGVLFISISCYISLSRSHPIFYIPLWFCLMAALLFLFAQFYLPLMFVTFDITFGQAYKNAFAFAFAGWKRNLLLTAVSVAALLLLSTLIATVNLVLLLPLCGLILFSFFSLLINFTVYPLLDRALIKPYEKPPAAVNNKK